MGAPEADAFDSASTWLKTRPLHRSPMRPRLVAVALAAALAAVALPSAAGPGTAAQRPQVQVDVAPLEGPVEPESGLSVTNVTVEVPCGAVGQGGDRAVNVSVASKPSWVGASVSPAVVYLGPDDCEAANGTASARADLVVQTTHRAPAFQAGNLTVRASSDGMDPGTDDLAIEAGFYAVLDVQTARPVVVAAPASQVDLPVEVTNFGNGPVQVTAEGVKGAPTGGLEAVLPGPFTVGSNATGGENTRSLVVPVRTPGGTVYVHETGTIEIRWSAVYALDPGAGGTNATSAFRITTKGVHVPGPGPAAAVAGLAAAALAARRARRRSR